MRNKFLHISLLIAVVLAVYCGTFGNNFIWDDDDYIYQNPLITNPDGLQKIWQSFLTTEYDPHQNTPQYYPVVFTTFYLEHKLWGLNPAGYHATNALLHIANALLLLLLLRKLGLNYVTSILTAAIFALHPIETETVAWITERKNLLSTLFYFSAFICFLYYEDNTKLRYYIAAGLFFILAMLSKTVTVTLPVALILAAYLRQKSIKKTITRTIPFLILGLAMGLLTATLERIRVGAFGPEWDFSILQRFLIASRVLCFYIGKIIFPYPLAFFYRRWEMDTASIINYIPLLGIAVTVILVYLFRNKLGRVTIFALSYFTLTIAPALGFINFFPMRYSFVADHFQYLAGWSIMLVLVHLGAMLISKIPPLKLRTTTAVILTATILITCSGLTFLQTKKYYNLETLWKDTLKINPTAWVAHNNLGTVYSSYGQFDDAIACYEKTIELKPDFAEAYNNIGVALVLSKKPLKAIDYYQKAIELKPDYLEALYNLAVAYSKTNQNEFAAEYFKRTVDLRADYLGAWYNLAISLSKSQQYEKAVDAYKMVVTIAPNHFEAHYNLAITYHMLENPKPAIEHYKRTLELQPGNLKAHYNIATLYQQTGDLEKAVTHLLNVIKQIPNHVQAHFDLGMTYFLMGNLKNARVYFKNAENLGLQTPEDIKKQL